MHQTHTLAAMPAWFYDPLLVRITEALCAVGEFRFVGGVVRDLVRAPHISDMPADMDAATSLLPEQVIATLEPLGLKVIPTGIAHGTVTVMLPESKLEITTLRRDMETDGRHATVAFGTDFAEDAQRRDFTMNALYLDRDGVIHDYHDGLADAKAGRVRFIGNAPARIAEDALRILRFYRFTAQMQTPHIDPVAHDACSAAAILVSQLSGERIAQEMFKLLAAEHPLPALTELRSSGVCAHMACEAPDVEALGYAESLLQKTPLHALLRLRILLCRHPASAVDALCNRWKLSNTQRQMLHVASPEILPPLSASEWAHGAFMRAHGRDMYGDGLIVRAAYEGPASREAFEKKRFWAEMWQIPAFPLQAVDLLAEGYVPGKTLGDMLRQLEQDWEAAHYVPTREALLTHARDALRARG